MLFCVSVLTAIWQITSNLLAVVLYEFTALLGTCGSWHNQLIICERVIAWHGTYVGSATCCPLLCTACRLWHVPWHGWRLLLQTQRRQDSCQVDSSWGCFVQEVHHKEWCVELWDGDVRDMVTWTQAIWGVQHGRGEECDVHLCIENVRPASCPIYFIAMA